ncbi:ABC-2 type transport system permease protein [Murinocardiopsis flavida]|uniref:ABC-2 type transport system permease protein n=1 Tax=Murinocardiopsis flavida TaxID=645275 RepID=A0A2P8DMI9_9ACTN|nr:antibiotic ABC transporter [Murinocardiopsis flavida]PSK98428.1 ABC-2 type transport system permease protein [Murinocardiopsis flavida]
MSAAARTGAPRRPTGGSGRFTGAAGPARLVLRRDRVLLVLWLLVTAGIVIGGAAAVDGTYPTAQARQDRFDQVATIPMFMLLQSRAFDTTAAALAAQQAFGGATMCAGLGAVLLLVRHTRTEEQAGRSELLGGTAIGRHAPLAAALAVVLGAGVLLAAVTAAGLVATGMPGPGSVALGLVVGGAVWIAAALAAVAVQLTTRTGAAAAIAFGLFYMLHLVRGIGAMGGPGAAWLTWVSPNGWLENVRPYADERWWPFALVLVWTAALAAAAFALAERRDLGSAVLPARRGPAVAPPGLRSVPALAWRSTRGPLAAWLGAVAVMGAAMGYVGAGAMAEYADAEWVRVLAAGLGVPPADSFFVYVVFVAVFPIAAHAILTALRMRTEEAAGLGELLLSGPTARTRWALAHLGAAFGCPVLLLATLGAAVGAGSALAGGPVGDIVRFAAFTVTLVPAVWVVVGATVLAFGLAPRACAVVAWAVLGVGIGTEIAVKLGVLPEWTFLVVSPFAHVNPYFQPVPVGYPLLVLLAAALTAAGLAALRRRDLPA